MFAFVSDITKCDPDKAYFSQHVLDAICTFSFNERLVMKCVNTLYETRYSNYWHLLLLLVFVQKQHLVKVILFANILIGLAYPGQFPSKISIISTFIVI